jgi:hypothetical protein
MSRIKWAAISVGGVVAVAHIGVLGHLLRRPPEPKVAEVPTINIPSGPYTSYKITAGKEGYTIEYKANDPAILESQRSLDLNKSQSGFFGGKKYEDRREYRQDQYTMEGVRNMGGAATLDGEGKSAKEVECIVADAGARSQGAMAGSAVATGVLVPAVVNIPYIGWLAAGWAALLGQNIGSEAGSQVNSMISDC